MSFPNFPDHVLFNINVAVVAMILRKRYGFEFERYDDSRSSKPNEMWEMSEKLYNSLTDCLGSDDAILDFINWFFDGVRKTFESEKTSRKPSSFPTQQTLLFPDTCFQCKRPYSSASPLDKWCSTCESYAFASKFHTWTSGNVELDRFIRDTQKDATDSTEFLRWVDFSSFTDLNLIGKGGFSEVYTAKYTKDRLDGTLKQWVSNIETQIILNYVQCRDEDDDSNLEDVSQKDWENALMEFVKKMRLIYEERRMLKCKPRDDTSDNKIKRNNSFTKLKNLLKRKSKKSKSSKSKSLTATKLAETRPKITQVPATTSPLQNKFVPKTVVLKRLVNSRYLSPTFIREIKAQFRALKKSPKVPRMYGLTQDPQTRDFYIVLQYANGFDLHKHLVQNCASIDWWQRISILDGIVKGIYDLHKADLIHHNLHTGNILVRQSTRRKEAERSSWRNPSSSSVKIWISDGGLWGPAGSSFPNSNRNSRNSAILQEDSVVNSVLLQDHSLFDNIRKETYGVLPYIAPEVLQGKEYTKSSDIYSLGIVMWELSNSATLKRRQRHTRPFHDKPYDVNLAKEIVINEKRPNIVDEPPVIPECWLDLMKKCWASKPEDRPNIEDIMKITSVWNAERRKSLNLGSRSSLNFSLGQAIGSDDNNTIDGNIVVGQFIEAEKRRVERLDKGKQVERNNPNEEEKKRVSVDVNKTVNQDDDIHPEDSMKSQLIDFVVETNLNVIYEDSNSRAVKEKVDSGYQYQKDQDDDSLELEKRDKIDIGSEKKIEKEKDPNKHIEEPVLVQDGKKRVRIDDGVVKQDNKDSPIKNGIEANSEIGSKEITITKEKEP